MKNKTIQLTKITCPKCNYKWETKSQFFYVTCPKCLRKVEVEAPEKKRDAVPSIKG